MTIEHHLPEDLLLEYAAGVCDEALSLLIACHLTLCPICRRASDFCDDLGSMLWTEGPNKPSDSQLPDVSDLSIESATANHPHEDDPLLPRPLLKYTGPSRSIAWQRPLPGVQNLDIALPDRAYPVRLRVLEPGVPIPLHDHRAPEYDLVLSGLLRDRTLGKAFRRGDISTAEPGIRHELKVGHEGPCTVLSVHGARVLPKGLRSRLVYAWSGW